MSGPAIKKLKYFSGNEWIESTSGESIPLFNPSLGQQIAEAPCLTAAELDAVIESAAAAFSSWSATPAPSRVQHLFRFKHLLEQHRDELACLVATEMGKTLAEAAGELDRGIEIVEYACGIPSHLMGETLENVSRDVDVTTWRVPIGAFAGIVPFNFPLMIPLWMMPVAVACGNTFILKAANQVPQSAMRLMDLVKDSGFPPGVVNLVTCSNDAASRLIEHPDVRGVSFVGSTRVAQKVYQTAAQHGKRVQALAQAKNHCLVLPDCALDRTVQAIVNAAFGCCGQRCMALPVVVAHQAIADELVARIVSAASSIRVGNALDPETQMGPLVTKEHLARVTAYIQKGVEEGASLLLDGRNPRVSAHPEGFYLGPTVFDQVTSGMVIGREEIFGPVLCIRRAEDFEEGMSIINSSEFGNGASIFTSSGYHAREFSHRVQAGMVGINVAIPVPVGYFSFTGWKKSFFGDLHSHGRDGVLFYTEKKSVTQRWFEDKDHRAAQIGTWD